MMHLYSVYDKVAKSYSAPFVEASDEVAMRSFALVQRDSNSLIALCPDDYQLYHVADFDQTDGSMHVDPRSLPVKIADGRPRGDNNE